MGMLKIFSSNEGKTLSVEMSKKNLGNSQNSNPVVQSEWAVPLSLLRSFATFIVIACLLRASVVEAFKIPSESMVPTLEVGDHILVNKLSYGIRLPFKIETLVDYRQPKRNDVVVFTRPDDPNTNIIKRVIGLPGEKIEVKGTKLYINGKLNTGDEHHAIWIMGGTTDFGPVTVPKDHVLLLGDNRDKSKDSRKWPETFLNVSRIKGRAFVVYWNLASLKRMFSLIN